MHCLICFCNKQAFFLRNKMVKSRFKQTQPNRTYVSHLLKIYHCLPHCWQDKGPAPQQSTQGLRWAVVPTVLPWDTGPQTCQTLPWLWLLPLAGRPLLPCSWWKPFFPQNPSQMTAPWSLPRKLHQRVFLPCPGVIELYREISFFLSMLYKLSCPMVSSGQWCAGVGFCS